MRFVIAFVALTLGCAPRVDSVVLDPSVPRPATSRVAIFRDEMPKRPARVHGYLAAREPSVHESMPTGAVLGAATSTQLDALGREAAKLGCDAIVVRRDDLVMVLRPIIGPDVQHIAIGHRATCLVYEP